MKSLAIVLALCSLLTFIRAEADDRISTIEKAQEKEKKAIQECNATIPVQRNPALALSVGILLGEPFRLSQEEKCFLHCFLQKVGLLDENANVRDGKGFVNFTLRLSPEVAKYSDVLIAQLFQISRSTKGFDDNKCLKAYIVYLQLTQGIFVLQIADELQKTTAIRDKIITSIQTNKPVDPEVTEDIKKFKIQYETMMASFVKSALEQNAQKNNSTRR